jgi:hypothetical protein
MKKPKIMQKSKIKRFEYQILVNGKVVWRGLDAKLALERISKKYPKAEIGIKWVPKEGVLIAKIQI